jgi:hypothetical protein
MGKDEECLFTAIQQQYWSYLHCKWGAERRKFDIFETVVNDRSVYVKINISRESSWLAAAVWLREFVIIRRHIPKEFLVHSQPSDPLSPMG